MRYIVVEYAGTEHLALILQWQGAGTARKGEDIICRKEILGGDYVTFGIEYDLCFRGVVSLQGQHHVWLCA